MMTDYEVFRATYGFVQGAVYQGQALVVTAPKQNQTEPGLYLKPSTGARDETFYGIALIQQFSHYGLATKNTVIRGDLIGDDQIVESVLNSVLGDYIKGSEHIEVNDSIPTITLNDDGVPIMGLAENDVLKISYQYPLSYMDYVNQQGEASFYAFDHTALTQLPCGREGRYRTQFYVSKPYKMDQKLRLARNGRFQPAKKSSTMAIPGVRVISPPSPADPYLGLEIE